MRQQREAFEAWWLEHGQYLLAGGGDYENTFAYHAWQAALLRAQQPGQWLPIESAPKDGTEFLGYRRGEVATACLIPRSDCEMWSFAG
jgi:hypothetical protein